jgi:hypothetical protein
MTYASYLQYGGIRKSPREISKMRRYTRYNVKLSLRLISPWRHMHAGLKVPIHTVFILTVREWDVNCTHDRVYLREKTPPIGQAGECPWSRRDKMVRTIISAPGGKWTKILASLCHGLVTILRYVRTIPINSYDTQVTENNTEWKPHQLQADGMPTCSSVHATQ